MTSLRRALAGIAILGVLVGAIVAIGILDSDHVELRGLNAIAGAGDRLVVPRRRPLRLVAAARQPLRRADDRDRVRLVPQHARPRRTRASASRSVFFAALYLAVLVHMLLAYPSGRLETGRQAALVCVGYVLATLGQIPALLWGDNEHFECPSARGPLTHVRDDADLVRCFDVIMVAAAVAIGCVAGDPRPALARASPPQRRAMAPVLWSGFALLALFAARWPRAPSAPGARDRRPRLRALIASPPSRGRSCSACCARASRAPAPSRTC